jgi:hypothetical protein
MDPFKMKKVGNRAHFRIPVAREARKCRG